MSGTSKKQQSEQAAKAAQRSMAEQEPSVSASCPSPCKVPLLPNEESQSQAQLMATRIKNRLKDTSNNDRTMDADITYVVVVVRMRNGERKMIVTSSGERRSAHRELQGIVSRDRYVSPDENAEGETSHHAEQRALKWAEENPDVEAIEAIAPTRACCEGCTTAIQERGDPDLDIVETPPGVPKSRVL